MQIAIVGAGASGLMAAITLARKGFSVSLFEAGDAIGKKIAASGNGKCNISNRHMSPNDYDTLSIDFLKPALETYDYERIKSYFEALGLLFFEKEDGKAYPYAQEARAVVRLFESYLTLYGVKLFLNRAIEHIKKDQHTFTLRSKQEYFEGFDRLIMATGSQAAPQLGGTQSGLEILEALGHTLLPAYPALVQLESKAVPKSLSGLRIKAKVELLIDERFEASEYNDLLFTNYGVSGLAVLDLSTSASKALLYGQNVKLNIDLMPEFEAKELKEMIKKLINTLPKERFIQSLSLLLPLKLAKAVAKTAQVQELKNSQIDTKTLQTVLNRLKSWRIMIEDTHGFKHAEAAGGGVLCDEVKAKSFESKKVSNLYILGEALDVVGKRGGYNFHFAWASALMAAQSIQK